MPSINAKCQEAQNIYKKHNYAKYGNIGFDGVKNVMTKCAEKHNVIWKLNHIPRESPSQKHPKRGFKDIWSLLHAIFRTIGGNTEVLKKTLLVLGNLCAVFESVGSLFVELNWPL